mmetsp:Transcript_19043/g.39188  ORF Transcript_19043/g.39188 Transcript_19043/m.39188 type:complete len:154 (+) Transcript_19043:407-868(+)
MFDVRSNMKTIFSKELKDRTEPFDITLDDYRKFPVGEVYLSLEKEGVYGHLPVMARAGAGSIGTLTSESYCERCFSAANIIMDDGNALLGKDSVEHLVILRMNKNFMNYMRDNHSQEAGVVKLEKEGIEKIYETGENESERDASESEGGANAA